MGKPYDSELAIIPQTYSWAMSQDISGLSRAIKASAHLPLLAVGSGGSLSAAEAMVCCHQRNLGGLARAVTPLELISALPYNGNASVCFFSAGGGNIDIRRAFEHTLLAEPKHVTAIVGRAGSMLAEISSQHEYADLFEFPLPSGQDGFLATNSLLAFTVLVCRAYDNIFKPCGSASLPATIESLLLQAMPEQLPLHCVEKKSHQLWERSTIHVLYSNELKSVAVDIESKFIEAGLSSIHISDFRNFAHGRHHWLDKHGSNTAVLALSVPDDFALAEETIGLLPSAIPSLHVPLRTTGSLTTISGLVLSLFLTGYAGKSKGIDPGRPGVPEYGSKIYNLETASGFLSSINQADAAIRRKVGTSPRLMQPDRRDFWIDSYNHFKEKLSTAEFSAVVMDYDGTVVDGRNRYSPPQTAIVEQIVRLLNIGISIGFATGRGKSIRSDLREVIPKDLWHLVTIGYYNGAEISPLTDDNAPDGDSPPCPDLQLSFESLNKNLEICSLATVAARKFQLTVEPRHIVPENLIFDLAQDVLYSDCSIPPNIFRSSHSVDILAQGVSKVSVIKAIKKAIGPELDVLTIGDRGRWPGNDSILLKHVHSLSVDEVSPCKDTCWNVCPPGVRGPQGTLYYLSNLRVAPSVSPIVKLFFGDE